MLSRVDNWLLVCMDSKYSIFIPGSCVDSVQSWQATQLLVSRSVCVYVNNTEISVLNHHAASQVHQDHHPHLPGRRRDRHGHLRCCWGEWVILSQSGTRDR